MAQNNIIDLEQIAQSLIINEEQNNINNNDGQRFTRQTCDQIENSFNYSSERTPLARTFALFDCNDTNMDIEDPLQSRIERLENEQKRTETQISLLLEEIETLNHKLNERKNRIPFPEGHFLEVQEISGIRYLVVSEPDAYKPELNKDVINLMSFPVGHRISVQSILGHRFAGLYPQNDNGPLTLDDLQSGPEENNDINDDANDDDYDGYISDDFKFYGERIRFLRNKNPKNDDETIEEYEDRINKLGEEWLASDNAKNEKR
jgi:hypothetical protein